jgi:hypothetical protein
MNESIRGIGATVAVGLVSGVVGAVAGWLSELRELSGPPPTPRIVAQSSQPASQQVAAADDSGGRHQRDGDRESDGSAAAPNKRLPDDRPPHLRQSAKEAVEVPGAPSSDSLEGRAASFVAAQVSGWSSANAINLASLASAYADEILYYGSRKSRQAVLLDKGRLLERWPERIYHVQPGSITVQCLANVCKVGGITNWQTRSAPRATSASGTAQFEYEVTLSGDAFSILSENSSVVKRDRQANRR